LEILLNSDFDDGAGAAATPAKHTSVAGGGDSENYTGFRTSKRN